MLDIIMANLGVIESLSKNRDNNVTTEEDQDFESLYRAVELVLYEEAPDEGMKLGAAIKAAKSNLKRVAKATPKKDREKILYRLKSLMRDYNNQGRIHFFCGGKKICPETFETELDSQADEKIVRGRSYYWKITQKPTLLTEELKAMMFTMVRDFSQFLLKPSDRMVINELAAGMSRESRAEQRFWTGKVGTLPRYPMLFPNYDETNYQKSETEILDALRNERGFTARYLNGEPLTYYPVRLLRREWVSYVLCACPPDYKTYSEFPIHRFTVAAENTSTRTDRPASIRIDGDRKRGDASKSERWGRLLSLRMKISGPIAQHLSEMRFHEDPKDARHTQVKNAYHNENGELEWIDLEVLHLQYSYEFETWLLGLGGSLQILDEAWEDSRSVPIRQRLEKISRAMLANYEK